KWLKVQNKNNRKIPDDLLTVEEIRTLVDAADNPRDRCLIFVLYESGCRAGEIVGIRQKDIEIKKTHATVIVNGKTGARKIVLINSIGDLIHWMNVHPKKDINGALFVNNRNPDKALGAPGIQSVLKLAAKRAGIKKNVHPHLLRHSRLTHLAQDHTESELKIIAGWKGNSAMPEVYVHLSSDDIENKMLANAGIETEDTKEIKEKNDALKSKMCPRCDEVAPIGARFCYTCGMALDTETAVKLEAETNIINDTVAKVLDEQRDKLREELINEILSKMK
ncbi:MAG: tyrosine-type recombinase/integrase, partial [Candidatus Heimdallarchaeota archaeon]|nr:tyrosine-type recombinase/integrase [Candidatus Heimdallarchaeota archaeon]